MLPRVLLLLTSFALAGSVQADFSYRQSSRLSGGTLMRFAGMMGGRATDALNATVAVHGNKMVYKSDHSASIVDLDAHNITTVNFDQKSYSVVSFDEMKKNLQSAGDQITSKADVKLDLQDGPGTRTVLGKAAHEKIFVMTMVVSSPQGGPGELKVRNDMYLASDIPGSQELHEFQKKMVDVAWAPGGLPMMNHPEMAKAMAQLMKASAGVDGLPVYSVTSISGAVPGMPAIPDLTRGGRTRAAGSPPSASTDALMEITLEVSSYSAEPVEAAMFAVPEGYTKVDPPAPTRRGR